MKVLITGAHFTPAQAVIEELQKNKDIQLLYVGRKYTLEGDRAPSAESQILPGLGVKFIPLTAGRLKRDISILTLTSFLKIPIGFFQAFWIILTEQPNVVVSFGGYVAVPVVLTAWLFNKPILIHDQTLVFGLASTVTGFFATKIAVSFKDIKYPFKNKVIVTGNPIRQAILNAQKNPGKHQSLPLIFITGGNQGSHFINQKIDEILDQLTEYFLVIHQTGDSKFKDFEKLAEHAKALKNPANYIVKKFIPGKEMGEFMAQADVVISRAGANTLLELAYLGTPTIIIPIPYVQKNEQVVNAKYFAASGLGTCLMQPGLTGEKLLLEIKKMMRNKQQYKKDAAQAKTKVLADAEQKIAQEILLLK